MSASAAIRPPGPAPCRRLGLRRRRRPVAVGRARLDLLVRVAVAVGGTTVSSIVGSRSASGSPSTSSKRTTVMLSSPPWRSRPRRGPRPRASGSRSAPRSRRRSRRRRSCPRARPSRSGRGRRARPEREHVDLDRVSVPSARVIAERCGWRSASSGVRTPLWTSSATSEWSVVTCSSAPSAQPVCARVADMPEGRPFPRRRRRARR